MSEDAEAQDNELIALESIYGDLCHSYSPSEEIEAEDKLSLKGGELKIVIELPLPFHLLLINNITGEIERRHPIQHLPPISLHFTFPKTYPSISCPEYILSCKWIDRLQLSQLCKRLDSLWKENSGSEVMFTWAQCLKEETLELLNLTDSLSIPSSRSRRRLSSDVMAISKAPEASTVDDENGIEAAGACGGVVSVECSIDTSNLDSRTVQDISPSTNLLRLLIEYNEEARRKVFDSKLFECKVCFCEKIGSNCLDFWPCNHVYCKDCMKSYFEVQIKEGNFKYLKCPEEKCDSEANPKQVESLVSLELYHKWDSMLLSSTLSALGDIQPCPRQHCQYPVTIEDSQGHCPSCSFVFCGFCRFGWHGLEKCKFRNGEAKKVLDKYMNGTEEEKQHLEDRFGKKYLSVMVEEYLSSNYMHENAKECPRCRANIEVSYTLYFLSQIPTIM
ncbi:UNVERIFIED_CONTAM: hypothetical protein GTU68_051513 [Idotea baltica]|nr:hypothetical protein [Idotea baltica]